MTVATDGLLERIEALENRIVELETQATLKAKEAAYAYIHSNWHFIRWYLNRQRDINGEGSDIYIRAANAERLIEWELSRNLRAIYFEDDPMAVAYRWRIDATFILQRNGYTFFD
jgi:hypothetical protein